MLASIFVLVVSGFVLVGKTMGCCYTKVVGKARILHDIEKLVECI